MFGEAIVVFVFDVLLTLKLRMRAALHSHILLWFAQRETQNNWKAQQPMPRTVAGNELKQRPKGEKESPQSVKQDDNLYYQSEIGKIIAEMPRPDVSGDKWGGYDIERLRIAGLYRHILERLRYLHICTPNYCLKGRANCRFSDE